MNILQNNCHSITDYTTKFKKNDTKKVLNYISKPSIFTNSPQNGLLSTFSLSQTEPKIKKREIMPYFSNTDSVFSGHQSSTSNRLLYEQTDL